MGLYNHLCEQVSWDLRKFQIHPKVCFSEEENGKWYISAPSGNYLKIGPKEKFIIENLKTPQSIQDLDPLFFMEFSLLGDRFISSFIRVLFQKGFLTQSYFNIYSSLIKSIKDRPLPFPRNIFRLNAFSKIFFCDIQNFTQKIYPMFSFLFSKYFVIASLLFILSSIPFIPDMTNWKELNLFSEDDSLTKGFLLFLLIKFVHTLFHEMGHALTTIHFKRNINRGGFLFQFGIPTFFVDTNDIWMRPQKERILVSLAGIWVNLLLNAIVIYFCDAYWGPKFVIWGLITVFLNLTPFIGLDGYFILIDVLRTPLLRERAFKMLFSLNIETLKNSKNYSLIIYALGSLVWILMTLLIVLGTLKVRIIQIIDEIFYSESIALKIFAIIILCLILLPMLAAISSFIFYRAIALGKDLFKLFSYASLKKQTFILVLFQLVSYINPLSLFFFLPLSIIYILNSYFSVHRHFLILSLLSLSILFLPNHFALFILILTFSIYLLIIKVPVKYLMTYSLPLLLHVFVNPPIEEKLLYAPFVIFSFYFYDSLYFSSLTWLMAYKEKIKSLDERDKLIKVYNNILRASQDYVHRAFPCASYPSNKLKIDEKNCPQDITHLGPYLKRNLNFLLSELKIYIGKNRCHRIYQRILQNQKWPYRELFKENVLDISQKKNFQESYNIEINFLSSIPLFSEFSPTDLDNLLSLLKKISYKENSVVIGEGNPDDNDQFFIVQSGQFSVLKGEKTLSLLGSGDFFGERSIVLNKPRNATIQAKTAGVLYAMEKNDFLQFMELSKIFKTVINDILEDSFRSYHLIKNVPLFKNVSDQLIRELAPYIDYKTYPADTLIFKQGDSGETFYIIKDGQVAVMADGKTLGKLTKGNYFGEIALFRDIPRTATIKTIDETLLLVIYKKEFQQLFQDTHDLERITSRRLKEKEMILNTEDK